MTQCRECALHRRTVFKRQGLTLTFDKAMYSCEV